MSKYWTVIPLVAVGLLGATIAVAQVRDRHGHDGRLDGADSAAWHQERCTDRYAHIVGMIAYLETRLALTDAQRPAFEAWKSVVLASAKSREAACAAHMPDAGQPPTILDREAREEMMLKARLVALDAELPALKALYQGLSPEQKSVFDHPRGHHEGGEEHDGDHGGRHGHGSDEDGPGRGRGE